ncbi:hypothetical protein C8J57DRAFT_1535044 [Mycena rebaudengoi]|nr:hypothetical protein C8J57DRAFT_1535044 [Mycena rebaudengoi]
MALMWFSQESKTCKGTIFSPFIPRFAQTLQASIFNIAPLLQASTARKTSSDEDVEDAQLDSELDTPTSPAIAPDPPTPPRTRSISPLPKCCRISEPHATETTSNYRHSKRRRRRNAAIKQQVSVEHPIHMAVDAEALPVAHGAYATRIENDTHSCKKWCTLQELIGLGFHLVRWDGFKAQPIVDIHGRIIAVLAGRPTDPTYTDAIARAFSAMTLEATGPNFRKGQTVPSCLNNSMHTALLYRLVGDEDIERMVVYASAAFNLWAPKVYAYYNEHDAALRNHLERNFPKSVFSSAAFNFGPDVWTIKHRDVLNAPFGMCAVQVLGDFDATKGSHLVLWDLKLVIEFPAGATILLPSATICHSNLPVQPSDTRSSFTQYTAGGLMRYVDNGFHTKRELAENELEEYSRMCLLKETHWEMGLALLSTVDELLEALP